MKKEILKEQPKFLKPGERGEPGQCVGEGNMPGHIPKLDYVQQQRFKAFGFQIMDAMSRNPAVAAELMNWLVKNNPDIQMCKSEEEGKQKINAWLEESVLPGQIELRGDVAFLEVTDWPHWEKIDPYTEYDLNFQWQGGNFVHINYFMFVVDIVNLKLSLRIAFELKRDLVKLKALQGKSNMIITRNLREFTQGLMTGQILPGLGLRGIDSELLNLVDLSEAGE